MSSAHPVVSAISHENDDDDDGDSPERDTLLLSVLQHIGFPKDVGNIVVTYAKMQVIRESLFHFLFFFYIFFS
jgi:hypothetical protein